MSRNCLSKSHEELLAELANKYHWYRSPLTRAELLTENPSTELVSRAVDFCCACHWEPRLCRAEMKLIARWQNELAQKTYQAALAQALDEWAETDQESFDQLA